MDYNGFSCSFFGKFELTISIAGDDEIFKFGGSWITPVFEKNKSSFSQIKIINQGDRNSLLLINTSNIRHPTHFYCSKTPSLGFSKIILFGALAFFRSFITINGLMYFEALRQKDHAVSRLYRYVHFTVLQAIDVICYYELYEIMQIEIS